MDTASVTVQLVPTDLERFSKHVERRTGAGWGGWLMLAAVVIISSGQIYKERFRGDVGKRREVVVETNSTARKESKLLGVVPFALFGMAVFFYFRQQTRQPAAYERNAPGVFAPKTYEVLDRGLSCRSDRGEMVDYWPVITRLVETDEDIYVMLAAANGHVLPKRCFPSLEAMAIFRNQMHMHLEEHAPEAIPARKVA